MSAFKAGILGCAALLALGCKKDPEVPPQPVPDAGPPPVPVVDPVPVEPTLAFGPCNQEVSAGMAAAIGKRATTEAASTKTELGFACQIVHEGEAASVQVFLDAGGCYTFLGHGFPEVTEVDLTVKPDFGPNPPPLLAMAANATIATDGDSGPQAAIGRKDCFKNPLPIGGAVRVEVKSRVGSGPVAVKAYKR